MKSGQPFQSLRLKAHTICFSELRACIQNSKVSFQDPRAMTATISIPPRYHHLWNVVKENVQKTDSIDSDLGENVCLR